MTDKAATESNPDRARRIGEVWTRDPGLTESQVLDQVDAELADEATERAEGEQWIEEFTASVRAMSSCVICGALAARSWFCQPCQDTFTLLRMEAAAESVVRGHRRRDLAVAYRDQRRQDRQKAG